MLLTAAANKKSNKFIFAFVVLIFVLSFCWRFPREKSFKRDNHMENSPLLLLIYRFHFAELVGCCKRKCQFCCCCKCGCPLAKQCWPNKTKNLKNLMEGV